MLHVRQKTQSSKNKIVNIYSEFFFSINIFFLYVWLPWVFVAVLGFSLVAARGRYALVVVGRLLIAVASLVAEHGLQAFGFQELQSAGSIAVTHRLAAPQHVESPQTRDRTRQIPIHCTTREVCEMLLYKLLRPLKLIKWEGDTNHRVKSSYKKNLTRYKDVRICTGKS